MKKIILYTLLLFTSQTLLAKKIKFAVDMGTYTISSLGIHVMGDFQTIAGYSGGDFNPATTTLTQEGSTTIYSIILNLPAFQKYEFKFVNGDQSYEAEFVPDQSRVGYNLNDNRWIYLDSLQNDTTFAGAVLFNGNAPAGKKLIRFLVDMQNVGTISPNGVHVAGPFQSNDPAKTRLYSFGNNIYEVITYFSTTGIQQFKYYNGKTLGDTEIVPGSCAVSGNRTTNVINDSILIAVCYNQCVACVPSGIKTTVIQYNALKIYPNPAKDIVTISANFNDGPTKIIITDITGKIVEEVTVSSATGDVKLNVNKLPTGVYQVYYKTNLSVQHGKLIIE